MAGSASPRPRRSTHLPGNASCSIHLLTLAREEGVIQLRTGEGVVINRGSEAAASDENVVSTLPPQRFTGRGEAGERLGALLADALREGAPGEGVLVLALSGGGVSVAQPVAERLGAALDVFVVRPLSAPNGSEPGIGAVASGGVRLLNEPVVRSHALPEETLARVLMEEERALERSEREWRADRPALAIAGRTVILVDDGSAAIPTLLAAAAALRTHGPARLVIALPLANESGMRALAGMVDDVVVETPGDSGTPAENWYESFPEVSAEEIRAALAARGG
jgi:putative phosphoribosyl transferase